MSRAKALTLVSVLCLAALLLYTPPSTPGLFTVEIHVTTYIQRADDGLPSYWSYHAGVLTTIGKNWIEDQLGDSPATDPAKWITVSTSASSPSAAWTQIPTELTDGGFARAVGTYASTGDGQWTISHQFTATTGYPNIQLTGLQWISTGDGNLLASDTITPVTLNIGDKLTVTWTITIS